MKYTKLILPIVLLMTLIGCSTDPVGVEFPDAKVLLVEDLAADVVTGRDSTTGAPISTGQFTFYSLKDNKIIANADSASTKWDIAFKGTTIWTNSGSSGPGVGGAAMVDGIFEEITTAPADADFGSDADGAPAITGGSGNGWYNYNGANHEISPVPGRTAIIRLADGAFAKIKILSFYQGSPDVYDATTSISRYYTFEYLYQPDGSKDLQ